MDIFTGVEGFFVGSDLTDRHKVEEERRESKAQKHRDHEIKQALTGVLLEKEMQRIIRERLSACFVLAGN
jgi:hypothetical protein